MQVSMQQHVASEPRSFAENSKAWGLMCLLCLLLSIPLVLDSGTCKAGIVDC